MRLLVLVLLAVTHGMTAQRAELLGRGKWIEVRWHISYYAVLARVARPADSWHTSDVSRQADSWHTHDVAA